MNTEKKYLLLITNHFPYGSGEAFLENEIPYLASRFDRVIIVARDVVSSGERKGDFQSYRVNPVSNVREKVLLAWLYFSRFSKVVNYLYSEIKSLHSQKRKISHSLLSVMIHDLGKALITAHHVEEIIKKNQLRGQIVVYSYWLSNSALAATLVRAKEATIKSIARAHGGDVYEFRHRHHYISYRTVLARELDGIFAISENGREHLLKFVGLADVDKVKVSHLGTRKPKHIPATSSANDIVIVSCSYCVPVKRIDLLIDALSYVTDLPIMWIHIGDGPLKKDLEIYAAKKLKASVQLRYEFMGALANTDLIHFYEHNFVHLFVNTSESEGIPVTIMEAQSFGIPVVAPSTGGVPEIVSDTSGMLFSPDASPEEISQCIRKILSLSPEMYGNMRTNALRNWETRYNAEHNFPTFVDQIFKLIA